VVKVESRIDKKRLYTTGQSAGCMRSISMDIKYPDLFAASLLVAGQGDAQEMLAMTPERTLCSRRPGMAALVGGLPDAAGTFASPHRRRGARTVARCLRSRCSNELR
jgi:poly(3-hydroxybutyrate) depolymerase